MNTTKLTAERLFMVPGFFKHRFSGPAFFPAMDSLLKPTWGNVCSAMLGSALLLGCFCSTGKSQLIEPPSIQNAESQQVVRELLVRTWERTPNNKQMSATVFTDANSAASEILLAFLLNRIQHNETKQAVEIADRLTREHTGSLDGWLLKSYLNTLLRNYDRAQVDLRSLKKRLDALLQASPTSTQQKIAAYSRMGQLVGYLQGPVKEKLNAELLESTIVTLTENCSPEELNSFNTARERILVKFDSQLAAGQERQNEELEKQARQDEQTIVSLNEQNASIDQTLQQLIDQQERVRAEGTQRVANLTEQLSPLEANLASISTQIGSVEYDLGLLYADLYNAQFQNNQLPPQYQTSTWFVSDQIRSAEFALGSLRANWNAVSTQLASLRNNIVTTSQAYTNQLAQLQQQSKTLKNTQQRNRIRLGKLSGGPEIVDGKKSAMQSRLIALTSYVELPTELYRQQMLDGISPNP